MSASTSDATAHKELLLDTWFWFWFATTGYDPKTAGTGVATALKAHKFWIVGTEIESESQNRPRKFGPPPKINNRFSSFPKIPF